MYERAESTFPVTASSTALTPVIFVGQALDKITQIQIFPIIHTRAEIIEFLCNERTATTSPDFHTSLKLSPFTIAYLYEIHME